jgi:hypothetical protein
MRGRGAAGAIPLAAAWTRSGCTMVEETTALPTPRAPPRGSARIVGEPGNDHRWVVGRRGVAARSVEL